MTLPGRMGTLRARDVMTRNVIVLKESDTIDGAVKKLKSHSITGAPVVNEAGKFVGILSISDLLPPGDRKQPVPLAHGEGQATWDLFELAGPMEAGAGEGLVSQRMSRRVVSITADAPLVEAARVMCDGHWHRVPVVDDSGALQGIISTMDILAALVNAADETK